MTTDPPTPGGTPARFPEQRQAHAQFKRAQVADEIPVTDGKDA